MKKEDVLNNFIFWKRAVIISKYKSFTRPEIFKVLNDTQTNKNVLDLLKFLENEGFIEVDKSRIPYVYNVNNNKLSWFLREGEIFKLCKDLIKVSMGLKPYYIG